MTQAAGPAVSEIWWRSADGLNLYARQDVPAAETGRLPVVCLHGLTRNSRDFEAVAPWIAGLGRRVITPDIRGRGRSQHDPQPLNYNPATYAVDILGLMAELNIERAILVGTSMGGLVGLMLSSIAPTAVAGIVFNDVGPDISPVGLERIRAYVGRPTVVSTWAEAAAYASTVAAIGAPAGDEIYDRFARRLFREVSPGKISLDYDMAIAAPLNTPVDAGAAPPSVWPVYEALAGARPILVIRGAQSDILEPATVCRMAELTPDFMAVDIPGVGHAPSLEEPEARAALARFLDRLP